MMHVNRRYRIFHLRIEDLAEIIEGRAKVELPEGSSIFDMREDFTRMTIAFKVTHPDWPEPRPGQMADEIFPTIKKIKG